MTIEKCRSVRGLGCVERAGGLPALAPDALDLLGAVGAVECHLLLVRGCRSDHRRRRSRGRVRAGRPACGRQAAQSVRVDCLTRSISAPDHRLGEIGDDLPGDRLDHRARQIADDRLEDLPDGRLDAGGHDALDLGLIERGRRSGASGGGGAGTAAVRLPAAPRLRGARGEACSVRRGARGSSSAEASCCGQWKSPRTRPRLRTARRGPSRGLLRQLHDVGAGTSGGSGVGGVSRRSLAFPRRLTSLQRSSSLSPEGSTVARRL